MPLMLSKPHRGLTRLFLPMCLTLGALVSTGCATTQPLTINVPDTLRAACERPSHIGVDSVGELAAFSVRQEAALAVCDGRREAVVALVDAHRGIVTPRPWWKVWGR